MSIFSARSGFSRSGSGVDFGSRSSARSHSSSSGRVFGGTGSGFDFGSVQLPSVFGALSDAFGLPSMSGKLQLRVPDLPRLTQLKVPKQSVSSSPASVGALSAPAPSVNADSSILQLDYPNAALASLYRMDVPTAYHEALANTSIQRRMADYQAAGLNPVLAASYAYGADSFSGQQLAGGFSGASPYGGANSGASGTVSSGKGFGALMRNSDYRSALASIASAGTMLVTKNFQLGAAAYYGVKGYLNSRYGYRRK